MNTLQWRRFYTLVYSTRGRDAAIVPISISAQWVRIEISILTFPRPTWYRAGWINQVQVVSGKPYLRPGEVVPLAPSIFKFENDGPYQVRFKPVPYLPSAIVTFYRSM
jgi:hypothetical protein